MLTRESKLRAPLPSILTATLESSSTAAPDKSGDRTGTEVGLWIPVLPNRAFCHEGTVLNLLCPAWEPLATCGY